MHVINRLLGRPTMLKAMACSLLLHFGCMAATYHFRSKPLKPSAFAGQRNAVYLETSLTESRPEELIEVRFEAELTPEIERADDQSKPAAEVLSEISPRDLPNEKRESSGEVELSLQHEIEREMVDVGQLRAAVPRRTVSESVRMIKELTKEPLRMPRRSVDVARPAAKIVVAQVAGVEDKTAPDLSGNRPPSYPNEAIHQRLEGTVVLRLQIADTGRVEHVEVSASSGHALLDRVAVEAVSQWRGRPAHQSGEAVPTVEFLPIRFRLRP